MKRILLLWSLTTLVLASTFAQEKSNLFDDSRVSKELKLNAERLSKNQEKSTANKLVDTPFNNRLGVGGINVKGNITYIGNNILSIDDSRYSFIGPNDDFNYDGNANTDFELGYIDIDDDLGIPGNNTTFSSSMSTLNLPSCSRIIYAGLYWAAIYPYDNWSQESSGVNTRDNDFNTMKLKLPGQPYQDITGTVIYDDGEATQLPYVCYSDVTSLVQSLGNPNGDYYGANIKATVGQDDVGQRLGSSAGWVLVVIYENDNESSKNISLFDGFSTINGVVDTDVTFSGFTTIPSGPVRVQLLTAALEGDKPYIGDSFQILNQSNNYEDITTGTNNQTNNFFNSSITKYNNFVNTRTPRSTNTLGFDVDLFNLNNPSNSIIANGQSSIDVRFTTAQDAYFPFLNALAVEIIEPKVQLIKTIEDAAGGDIQGSPVGLGSELFYNISFQNVGTDDARNTFIIDRLPKNVDLLTTTAPNGSVAPDGTRFDIDLPPGVTIVGYDPPSSLNGFRAELEISVPDDLVLEGGAKYDIRLHAQVVSDCSQLRDVCSNTIENQAFAMYEGVRGGVVVDNEQSYAGIDDCDFGIVGTSNFLVDTSGCSFETTQVICGNEVTLTAGTGFESYEWRDASGNLLATTTTNTYTVTGTGTYTVNKIASAASGCINADETINVIGFNSEPNPLQPFADQVLTCSNNGLELVEMYLCGDGGSRTINLPFDPTSETTVKWFQLDEASCADETQSGCPNVNTACTWNELGNGELSMNFTNEGEFRLDVLYDGQCPRSYYFNVYKATLTPQIITEDILCATPGTITINNIPSGYQYSLTGPGGFNAPFQDSNVFTGLTAPGNYNLEIRINNASAASCVYTFPPINIEEKNIDIDVIKSDMQCFGGLAQIRVQVNNVPGNYTYELLQGGSVVGTNGPTTNNDFTFDVSSGGLYTVRVTTPECTASEIIDIIEPNELVLSALKTKDITCLSGSSDGIIELTASGGTIDTSSGNNYNFAIWTSQGTDLYANASDVPSGAFLTPTSNPYTYNVPIGSEGVYRFIVFDDNNCYTISAPVEVNVEPELTFSHSETDITCNGVIDGSINVGVNGSNLGYSIEYSIDNTTWNTTGVFDNLGDGVYTIYVRASKNSYQCLYEIPNVTITEPAALNGGSVTATGLECNSTGTTFGTITFTAPTGGTPNYLYYYKLNSDSTYTLAASNPVTGLPAGTYNTRAIDARGCSIDLNNVTIDGLPSAPTLTSSVVYSCDGTGDVTITATPAGSYTYTLGAISNTTGVFDNIAVGSYTVSVEYGSNCTEDIAIAVQSGREFSGSITASSDSECFGSDNGSITISANNVIGGSFEYSVDGGSTWSITADNPYRVVGMAAGTYNVLIRETDGGSICEIDLGNVTIGEPAELTLSASVTQEVTCNTTTGTITASATGGIPPYEFSIDGGATWQTSTTFTNVPPRATDYTVMVRDSRNCNECGCTANLFENGSFEQPIETATKVDFLHEDDVPGWDSTAADNLIEIWYNGFNGVTPYEGNSFAELNANAVSSLYQEYCTQPGDVISWSVAHRGRLGTDVATVKIGADLTVASVVETMSDGNSSWGVYSGTYTVPVGQSTTIIAFDAVSTATGNRTVGNFIDDVQINIARTNCIPVSVPLNSPTTLDFTVTPVVCYDGSNGALTVNVSSGNDDYQFSLDNGVTWQTPNAATPTEYTFTGLTDGTYNVTVQDGRSCNDTQQAIILPQVTATVTTVSATCNDGQIVITPSGGDGTYQYYIEETSSAIAPITTTSSPVNVPSGTYNVYVRDKDGGANYCEFMTTVTVNQIADPTLTTSSVQPDCSTDTGTINVTVANGTAPYTVTVTGPGVPPAQGPLTDVNYTFTGLGDGTYQVTVTDVNGCTSVESTETITVPSGLTGGSAASTDLACSASGTILGTITFTAPTGGTPSYLYFYKLTTDTNYTQAGSTTVTNLSSGTYDTRVVDANGCILDLNQVTIADLPTEPILSASVVYNCDGTGNITVTPLDATYTYTLDGGTPQTSNVFNNVAGGAHTVSVAYGSNCTTDITVNVEPNQEFTAAIIGQSNPTCIGDSDGTITVEASFPSVTPVSFDYSTDGGVTWVNSGANPFAIPGFNAGTHNIQIRPTGVVSGCDVPLASVTLSDPTVITVTAPITKEITCSPATGATITPTASNGNGGPYTFELFDSTSTSVSTTSPFTDVAAGTYTVVATDRLGCTSAPVSVTVAPLITVAFTVTPVVCYDGSNGALTVNVSSGNDDYQFSLDNGVTWQTPNAATPTEYTFTGLTDGTYNVTVQDGRSCNDTQQAIILPQVTATVTTVSATCNDGQIVITPSGGDGTYQYYIEETSSAIAPITTTSSPVNVPSGTYNVYVRDKDGGANYCEFMTTVTVNQIADPTLTTSSVQPDCSTDTGTINVTVANGTAPYTVTVTGPGAPPAQGPLTDVNYTFTGLGDGTYQVTVTDVNGCTSVASTETITVPSGLTGGSAASTDLACSASGTILGTITFTAPTGGTPSYLYFYKLTTDTNYTQAGSTTVTNLSSGTYDTRVVDANGCILDLNQVTIADLPTEPILSASVVYNCDGTGNITVTPLDATYTYTLDGGTPQTSNVFNDVAGGAHTVSVAYGSNCTTDITVNVEPNQEFTAAIIGQSNPTCIGDSDGTITVEASFPSVTPVSFDYSTDGGVTWVNSGANPFAIPGFNAGTHNIQIRPTGVVSGCDVTVASVTLTDPTVITVTATIKKRNSLKPGKGEKIKPTAKKGKGGSY
ncbi:beta strand repeat-containing protein [Tenacibaculum sediminilitoris]|uniref:beta strand repeat-containing protein n=1 Tax=Tenacibaculum sediminilitoris TaxID=1820334 RepID=UPI0038B5CDCF